MKGVNVCKLTKDAKTTGGRSRFIGLGLAQLDRTSSLSPKPVDHAWRLPKMRP